MAKQLLDNPDLIQLKHLYESVLSEHAKIQKAMERSGFLGDKVLLNVLEEKEVELGLELDDIENRIFNIDCYNLQEQVEYLRTVLGILARREMLTEHPLVIAMNLCLHKI